MLCQVELVVFFIRKLATAQVHCIHAVSQPRESCDCALIAWQRVFAQWGVQRWVWQRAVGGVLTSVLQKVRQAWQVLRIIKVAALHVHAAGSKHSLWVLHHERAHAIGQPAGGGGPEDGACAHHSRGVGGTMIWARPRRM